MKSLIILCFIFTAFVIQGQPPQRFYGKFGGPGIDVGYGVKQTLDRNYIVVGSTSSYGAGNTDVYLVKVDSMGWTTWQKTFGGFGNDVGRSVIQLPDSGYVVAGFTNSYGAGGYDALLIRTDKNGNFLWQKTFGGTDWDFAYDLVYTSDAHIVICGSTTSFGHGNKDGFTAKYDTLGTLVWQKFFGGVEDDELKSIIKTNDNLLATVGSNKSFGDLNGNCYFLKLDLNGDTVFTRNFGGAGIDYLTDLIQKPYNQYILVGAKTYTNNQYTQSAIFSLSPTGQISWENNFYASFGDEHWVAVTNTNGLQDQTGYLRTVPVPSLKMQGNDFSTKYGSPYPYLVNSFGGSEDEIMYDMDGTKDGGYVSVGVTYSFNSLNGDVFFMKQDSGLINYQSVVSVAKNSWHENEILLKSISFNRYVIAFTSEKYTEMYLSDIYGRNVFSRKINSKEETLTLEEYPPGTYLLTIKSSIEKSIVFKLINY